MQVQTNEKIICINTDLGKELKCNFMRMVLEKLGSTKSSYSVCHPASNGVQIAPLGICYKGDNQIHFCSLAYNTSTHSTTNKSLYELIQLPCDITFEHTANERIGESAEDYQTKIFEAVEDSYQQQRRLEKSKLLINKKLSELTYITQKGTKRSFSIHEHADLLHHHIARKVQLK